MINWIVLTYCFDLLPKWIFGNFIFNFPKHFYWQIGLISRPLTSLWNYLLPILCQMPNVEHVVWISNFFNLVLYNIYLSTYIIASRCAIVAFKYCCPNNLAWGQLLYFYIFLKWFFFFYCHTTSDAHVPKNKSHIQIFLCVPLMKPEASLLSLKPV